MKTKLGHSNKETQEKYEWQNQINKKKLQKSEIIFVFVLVERETMWKRDIFITSVALNKERLRQPKSLKYQSHN